MVSRSLLHCCRFLDSIPKVQSAVTMLEEADGRFIKKQRGIISDNAMMLERASTKLRYLPVRPCFDQITPPLLPALIACQEDCTSSTCSAVPVFC